MITMFTYLLIHFNNINASINQSEQNIYFGYDEDGRVYF